MDISHISIILFIFMTIFYFSSVPVFGKPELKLPENGTLDEESLLKYYTECRPKLAIYFLVTIVSQFILNIIYLMDKCGGDIGKNIGSAALNTFVPWSLMFAVILAVINAFPGFKAVFSDVVGYYIISYQANDLMSSILVDTNMKNAIDKSSNKESVEQAAEAILKICGNKALLINQIYPSNFEKIWSVLTPLMKPDINNNAEIKAQLLEMVVTRENVGEAMWYVYTAILVSSIVYYNLATTGCFRDIKSIKTNYNQYRETKLADLNTQKQAEANMNANK
jgi:hypothetical protein